MLLALRSLWEFQGPPAPAPSTFFSPPRIVTITQTGYWFEADFGNGVIKGDLESLRSMARRMGITVFIEP